MASDLGSSQPAGADLGESGSVAAAQMSPSDRSPAGDTGVALQHLAPPTQPSVRDTAVEEELFRHGAFSDVVFRFRGGSGTASEGDETYPCCVYGQRAMFALFSPVLRETLLRPMPVSPEGTSSSVSGRPNDASASSEEAQSRDSKEDGYPPSSSLGAVEEVWLEELVTAAAFREVARYVYKLPLRLHVALLPEMLSAAQAMVIPELEALAYGFGMRHIGTATCSVGIALLCLERFRTVGSREFAASWQRALLRAYPTSEVLQSAVFQDLSLVTLQGLLRSCSVHEDESRLWAACLNWAKSQATREPAVAPAARPALAPRKLFGRAAQPIIGKPADSSDKHGTTKWQRWLLPLAPGFRFALMSDKDFAANIQGIHHMLPELRSAIYCARRRDVRTFGSPEMEIK